MHTVILLFRNSAVDIREDRPASLFLRCVYCYYWLHCSCTA